MEYDADIRTVIATTDQPTQPILFRALSHLRLSFVGVAQNGHEAVRMVSEMMPDLLLCDMVLPVWDGLEVVRRVSELPIYAMPVATLMTPVAMPAYERRALQMGVYCVLHRPLDVQLLRKQALSASVDDRLPRSGMTREKIRDCLWSLGLSPKLAGTEYLIRAIWRTALDCRETEPLGGLYERIATEYGVDAGRISHAMRRAIESAWSGGALERQHALFGNTIDARRGKPTNGEMIARIAELLRVKEI